MAEDIPRIAHPCPKSWFNMEGGHDKRHCESCNLYVHNFTEASEASRKKLQESGERVCAAYYLNWDGSPILLERLSWPQRMLFKFRIRLGEGLISALTELFLYLRRRREAGR